MNPWIIVGFLVALGAVGAGGYFRGVHVANLDCTVQRDKDRAKGQELKDKEVASAADQSMKVEEHHAQAQITYRTIEKVVDRIVDRPVYRNVCFDSDGLRAANSALTRASPAPRQPNGLVPAAFPAR